MARIPHPEPSAAQTRAELITLTAALLASGNYTEQDDHGRPHILHKRLGKDWQRESWGPVIPLAVLHAADLLLDDIDKCMNRCFHAYLEDEEEGVEP